ncbi:hypothetical protein M8C21_006022, partial [Ambrosia artemisiifolia]
GSITRRQQNKQNSHRLQFKYAGNRESMTSLPHMMNCAAHEREEAKAKLALKALDRLSMTTVWNHGVEAIAPIIPKKSDVVTCIVEVGFVTVDLRWNVCLSLIMIHHPRTKDPKIYIALVYWNPKLRIRALVD